MHSEAWLGFLFGSSVPHLSILPVSSDIHTGRKLLWEAESVEVDTTGRVHIAVRGLLLLGWVGQVGKRGTRKRVSSWGK